MILFYLFRCSVLLEWQEVRIIILLQKKDHNLEIKDQIYVINAVVLVILQESVNMV